MKLKKTALALSVLLAAGSAAAEFSANIGATSNYVWRGVTQTGEDAAISGGLDYAHESGFYAGTWASNVAGGEEVDLYGGFSGEAASLGYDVGVIYYAYPSFNDADFTEIYGSLSYGPVTGGINYTVDGQAESAGQDQFIGGDIYYYLSASFEVMPTWSLGGTVGYYDFDEDGMGGNDISYAHIQGDITKSAGDFGDFTFSLSKAEKESGDDDLKVFVSWAKTFE
ncbi:MAG: hypothetical protein H6956_05795 [Chromatiaceae bacterium]|nr:TorF family putative porin [Gammaproteobacteria bacterium]MCP5317425.1 hypothetical protein [Chromatiaceae bacterium]MCP5430147.1 hypothetical protein [Chromatiaceae bacterium]MCP5435936.1 hypothetical protein [Chromatiaceae bacterium]HPQ25936.1 TorF family putative porin [Gammaproteobacteria bacterium]